MAAILTVLLLPALAALAPPVGAVVELEPVAEGEAEEGALVEAGVEEIEPEADEEADVAGAVGGTPPGAVPFTQPGLVMVMGPEKSYCSP